MSETQLLFLAGAAVIVLLVVPRLQRRAGQRPGNSRAGALERLRRSGNYWGVTIRNGKCAAVRHCLGRHYRLEEAPALPVSGCQALRCSCTCRGLLERRNGQRRIARDRRSDVRFDSTHPDRRSKRERRRGYVRWLGADARE